MLEWFGKKLRQVQEVKRDERGFTLIELLVVVIIIGILAAIAIPVFLAQRDSAESSSAKANLRTASTAQQAAYTDTGAYKAIGDLGPDGFQEEGVEPPVDEVSQSATEYCFSSEGGGETWYMDHERGAPSATVCT